VRREWMIEIYHVSDLHIGRDTKKAQLLLRRIKRKFEIGEHENRYLLVTGDIVQHGWKKQYQTALRALLPFKDKVWIAPGNHDYGFLGFIYSKASAILFDNPLALDLLFAHEYFPKFPYSKLIKDNDGNQVLLIGLNSCLKDQPFWEIAQGEIGDEQRAELKEILNSPDHKDIPKIVFLHHIPHRRADGLGMSLKDYKQLMAIVKDKVDLLAFGHEGRMTHIEPRLKKRAKLTDADYGRALHVKNQKLPERTMKLRRGKAQGIKYYLDANHSVRDQACYRIRVEGDKVSARFIKFG
jgi:hypothetical protein